MLTGAAISANKPDSQKGVVMNNPFYIKARSAVLMVWTLLAALIVSGFADQARADIISEKNRIPLESAADQSWQTEHLKLDYSLKAADRQVELNAALSFSGYLRSGYAQIQRLTFWVSFADENGKVIGKQKLLSVMYRRPDREIRFQRNLELPQDARMVGFSYYGRAVEQGPEGSSEAIWQTVSD